MKSFLFLILFTFSKPCGAEILSVGEKLTIKTQPSQVIHVASKRPILVLDHGRFIEVIGKRIGSTVITQGSQIWRIHVVPVNTALTYRAFVPALQNMKGLALDIEDGKLTVKGQLLRLRDWDRLAHIQRQTGGTWSMKAQADRRIDSDEFYKEARKEAAAFGLDPSTTSINATKSIRLQLTIAEVLKSASDRIGLGFSDGQALQILPKLSGPDALDAKLGFMASNGEARILAQPSLVARPGVEAEFLAGGEFAVRTSGYRTRDVSWKRHGLWLRFQSDWRADETVGIKINTEFSHPDFSQMVDGIPSLKTHKTNTSTDLALGSTLLLSGLVQTHFGKSQSGITGLKDIPLIGSLFSSRDFNENRSELMVFIKPVIAEVEP